MYLAAWPSLGWEELCGAGGPYPLPFPLSERHTTYFHTARSGIYYLFKALVKRGRSIVLVPDYHMGNEVHAIRAAGAQIVWYPVNGSFEIDIDLLRRICRRHDAQVLFSIHYAGWPQPIEALRKLCDEYGLVLVEDCAMALLTEVNGQAVGSQGDYAIFCLYKTLPLPDGAVLVQNREVLDELTHLPLRPNSRAFVAGRIAELVLERFRSRHRRMGRQLVACKKMIGAWLTTVGIERVPVGDTGFNPACVNIGMASVSKRLARRMDYTAIKHRRREHFQMVSWECLRAVRTDLPPGVCPLFFPLLVADKRKAAQALWNRGVMATELWNEGDMSVGSNDGSDSQFLRRHVLELPIHQSLTRRHVEYMIRQVMDLGIALPHESIPSRSLQAV
jgi:dTDP-4-amino-4,6-dideoxygalactose transaminase